MIRSELLDLEQMISSWRGRAGVGREASRRSAEWPRMVADDPVKLRAGCLGPLPLMPPASPAPARPPARSGPHRGPAPCRPWTSAEGASQAASSRSSTGMTLPRARRGSACDWSDEHRVPRVWAAVGQLRHVATTRGVLDRVLPKPMPGSNQISRRPPPLPGGHRSRAACTWATRRRSEGPLHVAALPWRCMAHPAHAEFGATGQRVRHVVDEVAPQRRRRRRRSAHRVDRHPHRRARASTTGTPASSSSSATGLAPAGSIRPRRRRCRRPGHHGEAVFDGVIGREVAATVVEGVRRDIEHAHHRAGVSGRLPWVSI